MGSTEIVSCQGCGASTTLRMGTTMAEADTLYLVPVACYECETVSEGNIYQERPSCSNCNSVNIRRIIFSTRDFLPLICDEQTEKKMETTTSCPRCGHSPLDNEWGGQMFD